MPRDERGKDVVSGREGRVPGWVRASVTTSDLTRNDLFVHVLQRSRGSRKRPKDTHTHCYSNPLLQRLQGFKRLPGRVSHPSLGS